MSNLSNQQINASFPDLLQVPGGITSALKTVQDGNGNPTGLQISSAGANVTTSNTYVVSEGGTQLANAVPRLISDGFGDCVSVKDFGAVGDGVTNNLTAITNCIASANGKTIYVPVDAGGGDYAITSGTLTIPSTARFSYEAGARIYANGGAVSNSGRNFYLFAGGTGEGLDAEETKGFGIELLGGNTGTASSSTLQYNRIKIAADQLDASPDANGTKVDGLLVEHSFGGTGTQGGRHAIEAILIQDAITESANPDRNYVGVVGVSQSATGDGGTSSSNPALSKGGYFGGNFYGRIYSGALNTTNVTAAEFNSSCATGSSTYYRSGVQVVGGGNVRGTQTDAGIVLSNLPSATVTWRNAIRIAATNGGHAIGTDSTVLVAQAATTVDRGFSIPQCTGNVLESGAVTLTNDSFAIAAANSHIDLGSTTSSGSAYLDFNTSGNAIDYDARIIVSGGTSTIGRGNVNLVAAAVQVVGSSFSLGDASLTSGNLTIAAANSHIDLGSATASGSSYIDFNTSGNAIDYDSRIIASAGTGSVGNGVLALYSGTVQIQANNFTINSAVAPGTDNTRSLGNASFRWTVVYATTGTINTSDANDKQDIASINAVELRVATTLKSLIRTFRFKDAVVLKGDNARIHVGVIAQDVKQAFEDEGLNPERYGMFCSDTWTDEDGVEHTRLGVRYEELLAFIISAL